MTADSVLISRGPGETRVALLSAGRLKELLVAREGALSVAGNVYLGRVEAVKKGIEAAFVDIGLGRSGPWPRPSPSARKAPATTSAITSTKAMRSWCRCCAIPPRTRARN